uniref:IS30 family transposase n=1 Tax=Nocardia amikacinitolerans TaxID=756689 RepID=UPI001C3FE820|nr:IS30 family transposase [Nocardia amikacinitolerans]
MQAKLELGWSPQQISVWLRRSYPERKSWHVSHETIYQALCNAEKSGLSRPLTKRLRTKRSLRRRRRRADARTTRFVTASNLIEARPPVVDQRIRIGDWEGDLIVGARGGSALATLVDRRSRLVRLVHLPDGRNADAFAAAAMEVLATVPAQARCTLTWDQGGEMARHDLLAGLFSEGIYFARPGSPWMRATNENTNGLLRQYFPKTTDLSIHGPETLRQVECRINTRPRKVLGWRTATEVFEAELAV